MKTLKDLKDIHNILHNRGRLAIRFNDYSTSFIIGCDLNQHKDSILIYEDMNINIKINYNTYSWDHIERIIHA